MRNFLLLGLVVYLVLMSSQAKYAQATVLPEERADLMYHEYEGGGVTVNGPSLLVRKNTSTNTSVFYNYYVDHISSASLDVMVGGSKYQEQRTEQSGGIDYLHGKTLSSLSYTSSVEHDYKSGTLNFNLSQDFFGELSTLSMGYSLGNDTVGQHLPGDVFTDKAKITRQNYRLGLSQVLSKNFVMGANWETITDEGTSINGSSVTLQNPYRSYSYIDSATNQRAFAPEKYPNTHTSNALAISGNYFLSYRAALHAEVKFYQDSWGINASTYQLGYTQPFGKWTMDFHARWYNQSKANFYSDLFDYQDEYAFMARDRELSTFQDMTVGVKATMEFAKNGWGWIDRGTLNLAWDHVEFNYKDFRNSLAGGAPGTEPLYAYGANIYQFFVSIWY